MSAPETPSGTEAGETTQQREDRKILASSAVMAAGTVVSRLSGFVRSALLAAALGLSLHADIFTVANTIPNALYILLAGGVFNAVLVPQLVRAMKDDADGGEAYTNRVITLAALFLGAVSVLLVVAAPAVLSFYLDADYDTPALAAQRESVVDFARYCLPQVFFYGMFVLVGQILNSRRRFGPMMWAPIANNVISVAVLVVYLVAFGPVPDSQLRSAFTAHQELLLGLGSTLGIVAQLMILVPYLKKAGFTYRPRFDFRGTGLGHTFRLGIWTVLFVVVNQAAYFVVVNLASGGTAGGDDGTGLTVYSSTFLIMMVPHSIITVSLATAILPRLSALSASGDLAGLARSLTSALRTALAVVVPFAALLPLVAPDVANVILHGAARDDIGLYVPSLALFGPGLVFFTVHYLMLRGFYALEHTRTVFFIQCAVALTNIAVAVALVRSTDDAHTSPSLVLAYTASYAVGSLVSYAVLRRLTGGLETPRLVRFLVRLALATVGATVPALALALFLHDLTGTPTWPVALAQGVAITGLDVALFLLLARALRLREVTDVLDTVLRRRARR
ncbi:murein biosynthesis integral membrane protein MurJ [Nocardioides sp. KIGAM211]|uniref:Murein biosynthesis integral membrane protein MurJ n=1 Tax=Nocardioides luti TaxID=2761101 RepID=A0A7X0VC78_9ACTN|nr:murein biosynthesis integral membrane protein MurJ [Nocardioides luti]MBB6627958.1 murein biosynthesis integral membrane protein MurJ [Nocardioides luti]